MMHALMASFFAPLDISFGSYYLLSQLVSRQDGEDLPCGGHGSPGSEPSMLSLC